MEGDIVTGKRFPEKLTHHGKFTCLKCRHFIVLNSGLGRCVRFNFLVSLKLAKTFRMCRKIGRYFESHHTVLGLRVLIPKNILLQAGRGEEL